MIDGGEEAHRQPDYRDTFKGFYEVQSQASNELRQTLGVVQSARTYHYEGNPKFAKFRLAAVRLLGSSIWEPHVDFLASSTYRGTHSKEHRAIFTKPTDIYAELHELGHAFVARVNPDFDNVPEGKWNKAKGVEDRVARFGLGEGLSEWIAIASGFRTQDPKRVEEVVARSNKHVMDDPSIITEFGYSREVMAAKITRVNDVIARYKQNPVVKKNIAPGLVREAYEELIESVYWDAMSLGYVFTAKRIAEGFGKPEHTVSVDLASIIKSPPTLPEMEEVVEGFSGFLSFTA